MGQRPLWTQLSRSVQPELLDGLSADDPDARRSRGDLRRIHRAMATLSIVDKALDRNTFRVPPQNLLELGAGDGSLMLRLANRKGAAWPGVRVTLLDRLNLIEPATLDGLRAVGWTPRVVASDVFDWLATPHHPQWDLVVANLFMHHFSGTDLTRLLEGIAARTRIFFCCEPRRSVLPMAASHLIGLLGAGAVTRKDAVSSVRAGFRTNELTQLWPDPQRWVIREYAAGPFSHCFLAVRRAAS